VKLLNFCAACIFFSILADRTNDRAYATVLRTSVVCLYGLCCG